MTADFRKCIVLIIVAFMLSVLPATAAEKPKLVEPPTWSQDVLDAFFDDAREHLVGERPQPTRDTEQAAPTSPANPGDAEQEFKWSRLVEAETLTAEIKRLNNQLATALKKSASFQAGGNLMCRRDYGLLAVLFGVIADYDQDVRWQRSAATMQQQCLKASRNCKAASSQTYASAKQTQAVLQDLLRGQGPGESDNATAEDGNLADRPLLMQCMELAVKDRLSPALANAREFRRRTQQTAEQAQLLAVLAEVMQQDGYEYADDEEFTAEADQLRDAASELAQAARDRDYEAARAAAGRVGQSCSRCHEGYRG